MSINIDQLAKRQLNDFRLMDPGTCFEDPKFKLDEKSAYSLQDEVTRLRAEQGERVAGYKVGCTGPGTTKLFGMDGPIRGTLFKNEMKPNGAVLDYHLFYNLAVEAEMAIQIGGNNEIESVFPIIELHNFVFRAPQKSLAELIANNGFNKGIVIPEKKWQKALALYNGTSVLSLEINGSVIDFGDLWPMVGGPTTSLNWLEKHLADHSLKLSSGDIVLGGTALGLYPVQVGDHIGVRLDGQLTVHCKVQNSAG
mgnify:FL=1